MGDAGNSTLPSDDYFYNFGIAEELDEVPWWTVICNLVVISLGLFGNLMSMSLLLILKEVRKTSMHLFVFNLAVSDTLFLITIALITSQILHRMWVFSDLLCKLTIAVQQISHASSVLLLTAMSIGRFADSFGGSSTGKLKAVWRFFRNYTYQVAMVCIIWIISALYSWFFSKNAFKIGIEPHCTCSIHFPKERNCSAFTGILYDECQKASASLYDTCIADFNSLFDDYPGADYYSNLTESSDSGYGYGYDWNYLEGSLNESAIADELDTLYSGCHYIDMPTAWFTSLYLRFVFTFLIPSLVMIVFNYSIARNIMKSNVMRIQEENESQQQGSSEKRLQAIKCIALVVCFIVCWLPNHAVHMFRIKGIQKSSSFCFNLQKVASLAAYCHSALNPFIYMTIGNDLIPRIKKAKKIVLGLRVANRANSGNERGDDENIVNFKPEQAGQGYSISFSTKETPIVKNAEGIN